MKILQTLIISPLAFVLIACGGYTTATNTDNIKPETGNKSETEITNTSEKPEGQSDNSNSNKTETGTSANTASGTTSVSEEAETGTGSINSNHPETDTNTETEIANTSEDAGENSDDTGAETATENTSEDTGENSGNSNANNTETETDTDTATETVNNTFNPSDEPYFKYQWHLNSSNYAEQNKDFEKAFHKEGYRYKKRVDKDADIHIKKAWKLSQGKGVIVAVIDTGADVNHEDLKENIYKPYNADKKNSDVSNHSKNHVQHGNTCAGFIAASANSKGTIGVAPFAKLMPIKIGLNSSITAYIRAFEYAKNNGAKVISCSWGSDDVSEAIESELQSLYDAGITVLFASGNEGKSKDSPGHYDESEVEWVIGVGATGEDNDITPYSNYGKNIDIVAPGGDADNSIGILGLDDTGKRGSQWQYNLVSNHYAFGMGTSYACPVAAGVVALMYDVNPDITPGQVRDILISTTDKIGKNKAHYILNKTTGHTFDKKRAYGKINAAKAVQAAKELKEKRTSNSIEPNSGNTDSNTEDNDSTQI